MSTVHFNQSGLERAAILFSALDPQSATLLFKNLNDTQAEALRTELLRIEKVPDRIAKPIVDDFLEETRFLNGLIKEEEEEDTCEYHLDPPHSLESSRFVREKKSENEQVPDPDLEDWDTKLLRIFDEDENGEESDIPGIARMEKQAHPLPSPHFFLEREEKEIPFVPQKDLPFSFLQGMETKDLVSLIEDERISLIAGIIRYLPLQKQKEILWKFPVQKQEIIQKYLDHQSPANRDLVCELERFLYEKFLKETRTDKEKR